MAKTLKTGMTIGKAKVVVDIVDGANKEIRPRIKIKPSFITYHNTGNRGKGADAKAHNNLIHNLGDKPPRDTSHVSWHFAVCENYIFQHLPLNELAYHCGDGIGTKSGNMTSIGIEICMHSDQSNYHQAEENAIALGVFLAQLLNIPEANHVPHKRWSGKNCPQVILERDGGFDKFHKRIKAVIHNKLVKEDERVFRYTSKALQTDHTVTRASAERRKIVVEAAITSGYVTDAKMWRDKLSKNEITADDIDALATGTLVKLSKKK